MVRAVLFDLGGTLDADGLHWLDRFGALYASAGVQLPRQSLRDAFDAAEALAAVDQEIATAGLDAMVARHVGWQLDRLGLADAALRRALVDGFVGPIRATAARNRRVLAVLAARGFVLGVLSNGCGNVDVLCREYGYEPFLSAVVDSRRIGIAKPDRRIFLHAAGRLGVPASDVLMVGDSFERDIVPARLVGMTTAWFQPDASLQAPDPSAVDIHLVRLADLLHALPAAAPVAPAAQRTT